MTTAAEHLGISQRELEDRGYRLGVWSEIDANICAQSVCGECRQRGVRYEAWRRSSPRSYIALAICPACGNWWEF